MLREPLLAGARLPDVILEGPEGRLALEAIRDGDALVVVFYVEDGTPTCTTQLSALGADLELIEQCGAQLIAISSDSVESHASFRKEKHFAFPLLTDSNLEAARAFGVADETTGRCTRAVFVSDRAGRIVEAIPHYNPANLSQYAAIFAALGLDPS